MARLPVGSVQQHIFLSMIETIVVSRFTEELDLAIGSLCRSAYAIRELAGQQFKDGELQLLSALGLRDWSPPEPLSFTQTSSAVTEAGRLDANYFAPQYEAVLAKIEATGAAIALGDAAQLILRGSQPDYQPIGLAVINSKHVRKNRVLIDDSIRFAAPGRIRIRQHDVLVNGTGVGTIGRAAPYLETMESIPDNHVTIVRLNSINPLYLSVYINSAIGQLQIERMISGSSGQIELYPGDIRKILIWDAPANLQLDIANAIQQAFALEATSDGTLAAAKRAVEIAIEDGEAAALTFLNRQEVTHAPSA
jgi:type I restriction enzyme M protein